MDGGYRTADPLDRRIDLEDLTAKILKVPIKTTARVVGQAVGAKAGLRPSTDEGIEFLAGIAIAMDASLYDAMRGWSRARFEHEAADGLALKCSVNLILEDFSWREEFVDDVLRASQTLDDPPDPFELPGVIDKILNQPLEDIRYGHTDHYPSWEILNLVGEKLERFIHYKARDIAKTMTREVLW